MLFEALLAAIGRGIVSPIAKESKSNVAPKLPAGGSGTAAQQNNSTTTSNSGKQSSK
jgi:hypothetical protein